jgi:hypothetical protein
MPSGANKLPSILYSVRIRGFDCNIVLLIEADDFIDSVMKATEHIGKLNEAIRKKFPEDTNDEDEFVIDTVYRSEAVIFTDEWLQKFVDALEIEEYDD